ncbi:MAG: hypothetical protein WBG92_15005 [Thiohalocapsa sp.]
MQPNTELLFVYNADSGLFNSMTDAAHKILSPETYTCNLCQVTYGLFTERAEWRAFIESLDAECRFLHRDELQRLHPELAAEALPAVFRAVDGKAEPCVNAEALNSCVDLDALIGLIRERCGVTSSRGDD